MSPTSRSLSHPHLRRRVPRGTVPLDHHQRTQRSNTVEGVSGLAVSLSSPSHPWCVPFSWRSAEIQNRRSAQDPGHRPQTSSRPEPSPISRFYVTPAAVTFSRRLHGFPRSKISIPPPAGFPRQIGLGSSLPLQDDQSSPSISAAILAEVLWSSYPPMTRRPRSSCRRCAQRRRSPSRCTCCAASARTRRA